MLVVVYCKIIEMVTIGIIFDEWRDGIGVLFLHTSEFQKP